MILASLVNYYHRLATELDSTTNNPKVPPYGFSEEKIGYILVLDRNGNLVDVIPNLTADKKPKAKLMNVPRPEKRTYGIKSNFLWDKTAYVLGVESNKDKATAKEHPFVLSEKTFAAFKKYHLKHLTDIEDQGLQAIVKFLNNWLPAQFAQSICPMELLDSNVVFKLDGEQQLIHQRPAAQQLWGKLLADNSAEQGVCLITGEKAPIARLHPAIKGVLGGQKAGGSIISFNQEAFTSFNKTQGDNAPVSEQAAFAYTTALNYLLRRENRHCLTIGDTSTVFWAEAENSEQAAFAEEIMWGSLEPPADDEQESSKIFNILDQVRKGRPLPEIDPKLSAKTQFFILGLAPNASRISIRFWLKTDFGQLAKNLANHWADLALEPCPWKKPPSLYSLLLQTTPLDKTSKKGKAENISPILAGELAAAIFNDTPYPTTLLSKVISRFRADGQITGLRVAMVKAVLQRKYRKGLIKQGVPMGLDKNDENTAYLLGRLFAILETIQYQALGDVNANIVDRYYASASTVPFSVFPRLITGSKYHLARIRKDNPGKAVNLDRDLGTIIEKLNSSFPRRMNIEEQGRFTLGYHHQRQYHFNAAKKESTDNSTTTTYNHDSKAQIKE
ncbi:type I-C CRISPR-associated protein Cas8c/Csd1 [Gallibacterium anatis]|uniref:type I-C CRISPR-associated protein Cas8c/Csd1 n=1 Tax=Gallibacterium anatis TaxID=750 RepID=UPI000531B6DF|nr:type I-C CRISPR-associated protein Cas8c/Csd1 [Gallibacterium anatis]KGQ26643.1 CRISPR-associated protein Csd1 [Gallibacterium anatis]KGQ27796.1 CRISPR-associated protein Csd1 [Gallibacterium anatis]